MCALVVAAGGVTGVSKASAEGVGTAISNAFAQDAAPDNTAAPNVSGTWQISWTARNGNQRQATMRIKQDGSKLSGKFEGERGSAGLKGSLEGNQITLNVKLPRREASFTGTVDGDKMNGTTEQGVPWSAARQ
jgi:hypothetical protein